MKRFEAIKKDESDKFSMSNEIAVMASYDIVSEDENRAEELLLEQGENPYDFELIENSNVKDQSGKFFKESIRNCRL